MDQAFFERLAAEILARACYPITSVPGAVAVATRLGATIYQVAPERLAGAVARVRGSTRGLCIDVRGDGGDEAAQWAVAYALSSWELRGSSASPERLARALLMPREVFRRAATRARGDVAELARLFLVPRAEVARRLVETRATK